MKNYGYYYVIVDELLDDVKIDDYAGTSGRLVSFTYANGKYIYVFEH